MISQRKFKNKIMIKSQTYILLTLIGILFISSCKDDDEPVDNSYIIPTTYNFENVSYDGQTQRLSMFTEFKTYMNSANSSGTTLDVNRLVAMYSNDAANAQWQGTYEASKQMRGKTFEPVQSVFDGLISDLATASQSTEAGLNGIAGVVQSNDGAKNYLLNENGLELGQVIEKGLMGALLYYQSTGVYMESGRMDVDNEVITAGEGTDMEHHWDEAFGYFGVPTDFPTNTDNVAFWGDYCNDRDALIGTNKTIMDAFLKGRAAISNKDLDARDEAIQTVREGWEMVVVGTALHYLNSGLNNFDDMALRAHALSEAIGFVYSLQFNPIKKITNAQVEEILILIGGTENIANSNIYNAEIANIQSAKDQLAEWFSLTDKKDEF